MSSTSPDTRTKILTAALALLEARTGSAVRMSDIARAAGISRQAVYLHFPNRADLLIAATRHLDQVHDVDAALAPSRAATSGAARLEAYVTAWTGYIPVIYGVAQALLAIRHTDPEAQAAWRDRMDAMHLGCLAATRALADDGALREGLDADPAADILWAHLSVENWAALTGDRGWRQEDYVAAMQAGARHLLMPG